MQETSNPKTSKPSLERVTWTICHGVLALAAMSCSPTSANSQTIDGQRALEHVRAMVSYGPHPPGSDNQKKVGLYLIEQLRSYGLEVQTQAFTAVTPHGPREMINIWAALPGSRPGIILLCSHYDTKHFGEFRFLGANDSGSSSGVLLELARSMSLQRVIDSTVWFVFFDGEEAFGSWSDTDSLYGSREFVRMLRRSGKLKDIKALVLLDLVGSKTLRLRKDVNSTDWLNRLFWDQARKMGHDDIFVPSGTTAAQDDHIPFLAAGIPAIDLIDLDYPYWHTPEDTPDKLSAGNLEIVGNVVLAALPEVQLRLEASR